MRHELVLDRRRRHVLALAGLEQILHATDDPQVAFRIELALVAGAQPAVLGQRLLRQLGLPVIAQHLAGAPYLDLGGHRIDAALHAVIGHADRSRPRQLGKGRMRDAAVLGHAIDLGKPEAQPAVPVQQLRRHRGGTTSRHLAMVEAERPEDLLRHDPAHDRDAEQPVELRGGHLREHALLELDPQARHRKEDRRPGALQVRRESRERVGEVDVHAAREQPVLDERALGDVRQRQVAQDSRMLVDLEALAHGADGPRKRGKALHHAFRHAGRAGRVDDGREFVAVAHRAVRHRCRRGDDAVPGRAVDCGRERQADPWQIGRDALLHRLPAVELADEQQPCLAVLENLADRAGGERRIQRHGHVPRHPDGEVGHEPVRRVLGKQPDAGAGLEPKRPEVRGHAPRLVHHLAPGEVPDCAASHRLGQHDPVGRCLFPVIQPLQCKRGGLNSLFHVPRALTRCASRAPAAS